MTTPTKGTPSVIAKAMTPPPVGEASLGSPFGRAVGDSRLRGPILEGGSQRGAARPPFGIRLDRVIPPLPYRKANDYLSVNLREGGRGVGITRPEQGNRREQRNTAWVG